MKIRYIGLVGLLLALQACNDPEDVDINAELEVEIPELTAGTVDFSSYVAVGNSLTAGFTDGALFKAAQENSMPSMLAAQFAKVGGGSFTQPFMNDNFGGLLLAGNQIQDVRFVFDGAGPAPLNTLNPAAMPTTDLAVNNPSGPFHNFGIPGAKAFHMVAPGYGNIGNLAAGLANPYFVRMTGATPDASMAQMAMAQNPTFFTLWAGNNDVLGYATTGGDGSDAITGTATFDAVYAALIASLTSTGAKGAVANIPYVTSIPHFTTVPHNPLDPSNQDFGSQIPTLNTIYGAINQIFLALGETERVIVFSTEEASAVVIKDESLNDLSAQIIGALNASATFPIFVQQFGLPAQAAPLVANLLGAAYGQARQATEDDLLVLPSSSTIGTVNTNAVAAFMSQGLSQALAGQFSVEGVSLPLEDKWVLIPAEQAELKAATDAFNATIKAEAEAAGLAFLDANTLMQELAAIGVSDVDYTLTADLVTGGAFSLDGVHPTAKGYALLANKFLEAIDTAYNSNFVASENVVDLKDFPSNYPVILP